MMTNQPVAAIILAAGRGTRMKSDLHKVLHPLAGRPMLLHLLASVDALEPAAKVVVVGSQREQVEAAIAGSMERTALILVGRVLSADDFTESSLYARGYDRRFRPSNASSRFQDVSR